MSSVRYAPGRGAVATSYSSTNFLYFAINSGLSLKCWDSNSTPNNVFWYNDVTAIWIVFNASNVTRIGIDSVNGSISIGIYSGNDDYSDIIAEKPRSKSMEHGLLQVDPAIAGVIRWENRRA
ncbi:hypothetical protein QR680_000402 [Steinernema hermaphroditum]|uniref:Uncharacterized protein n=1 Tax=Steinernema hermaphroditum TaxID=289476 RepID=A0AA39GUG6_9BILA|nr:hypothetical protein QR680_000402 [Steinernema hermaphroditum]